MVEAVEEAAKGTAEGTTRDSEADGEASVEARKPHNYNNAVNHPRKEYFSFYTNRTPRKWGGSR